MIKKNKEIFKIALIGDISLNNKYCISKNFQPTQKSFYRIKKFLRQEKVDLLLVNLESPIIAKNKNPLKEPSLHTNQQTAKLLNHLRPQIVNIGNNHIFDYLQEGFIKTTDWLHSNGFLFLGAGLKKKDAEKIVELRLKNRTIKVISYTTPGTHPSLPKNGNMYLNFLTEPKKTAERIKKLSNNGKNLVIVSIHWGKEFSHYPTPQQRDIAHLLIDSGANIIYGHHTHTLQGIEKHKNGYILYSLGNFSFSDVIAKDPVLWTDDQLHGGVALIDIDVQNKSMVKNVRIIPTAIKDIETKIEKKIIWMKIIKKRSNKLKFSPTNYKLFWRIYNLWEFIIKRPFKYFFGERKNLKTQIVIFPSKIFKKTIKLLKKIKRWITK
ncbi:CapA family protein [Patescibacteria group bacterium]|nr:CapA family protein [Patescibacteria group bacterium]